MNTIDCLTEKEVEDFNNINLNIIKVKNMLLDINKYFKFDSFIFERKNNCIIIYSSYLFLIYVMPGNIGCKYKYFKCEIENNYEILKSAKTNENEYFKFEIDFENIKPLIDLIKLTHKYNYESIN